MKLRRTLFLPTAAFTLLSLWAPQAALATARYVAHTTAACGTLDPCYTSIQAAINAAVSETSNNDTIEIQASPDPYTEKIILPTDLPADFSISLYGTETARTVISGGGTGTVITADNPVTAAGTLTVSIWNVTIASAAIGIQASNKVSAIIKNSVFHDLTSSAIRTVNPQSVVDITNNTFHRTGTAISRDTTSPAIKNNIFSTNTVAVSTTNATNMSTNSYYNNGDDATGPREASAVTGNPNFVSIANGDFHLQASAACCINTGLASAGLDSIDGTAPDIGAYGGSLSDTIPFPVSGLQVTGATATSISLSWNANASYQVTGYNVYYGSTAGSYPNGPFDAGAVTIYTIPGLSGASPPAGAPVLTWTVANETLVLFWDAAGVTGATGYEVRYDTVDPVPDPPTFVRDAGNTIMYPLSGLQNGVRYYVVVVPYAKATFYIVVKAYYKPADANFHSAASNEVKSSIGVRAYGLASNQIDDYPERLTANPDLPDSGCFIATAAYGHYSANQVQALRLFRDRYLLTNRPGSAFVRWYYTQGPAAAQFINDHPWLKPVVRTALLPAVVGAMLLTQTSGAAKTALLLIILLAAGAVLVKKRHARAGGPS